MEGAIEVICGPMFSGKTEELIRRLRRAEIAQQNVQVFKPVVDDRYAARAVVSHNDRRTQALPVSSAEQILEHVQPETNVVGVDEAQFFEDALIAVVDQLADEGKRVIVAGLDMDFRLELFHPMPALMARAEYVTKLLAICMRCGSPANRSQRTRGGGEQVEIGADDQYIAVCRSCFQTAPAALSAVG